MSYKKSLSLCSWLLLTPLKFALTAFLIIFLFMFIANLINPEISNSTMVLLVFSAIIVAAFLNLRKLPRENMDQNSFVALNNAQILIGATLFIAATIIIAATEKTIMAKIMWMNTNFNMVILLTIVFAALFILYLCGIFITNIYAKYMRCKEIGISSWKIVCSMPFGFSLLWLPGYLLQDKNKTNPAVISHTRWYSKVTKKITSNTTYTTIAFIIITAYSSFFYGFNISILTLASALIFAVWFRIAGLSNFRQHQNNKYAYVAIIINVITIISAATYFTQKIDSRMTINISDVETTQTTK